MMMRRLVAAVSMFFLLVASGGLGQEKTYSSDLFPLEIGTTWTYRVTEKDSKSEPQKVTVKVDAQETLEVDGKKIPVTRLEIKSGDRKLTEHVAVGGDGVYRFSSADKTITPPLCFLKLGVMTGQTWQIDTTSEGAKLKGTFTIGREAVNVPYFKAEKRDATTSICRDFQVGPNKTSISYWFVDKIGMVKQHVQSGNHDVTLELTEYQPAKAAKK